jgi:hypothetical protein
MNTNYLDMLTGTQQGWFCTISTASQVNIFSPIIFNYYLIPINFTILYRSLGKLIHFLRPNFFMNLRPIGKFVTEMGHNTM